MDAELYDYSMRYDAAHYGRRAAFDSASHTLTLRLDGGRPLGLIGDKKEHARLSLGLARGVPLDVALRLGAVEADLDLGGLAVDQLNVESAASSNRASTSRPRILAGCGPFGRWWVRASTKRPE